MQSEDAYGVGDACDSSAARVVVNEILANEPDSVTAGEFVELVNLGNQRADLSGWTLSDSAAIRHTFAPGTRLAPMDARIRDSDARPMI